MNEGFLIAKVLFDEKGEAVDYRCLEVNPAFYAQTGLPTDIKMNHRDPYLVTVFGFMGITDIIFINVENDEYGGQKLSQSIAKARTKIAELTAV